MQQTAAKCNSEKEQSAHGEWGNRSEWVLAGTTVLLLFATTFLALYTAKLFKATADLAGDSRRQFIAMNRPKLILRDAMTAQEADGPICVKYLLANIGGSTATVIDSAFQIGVNDAGWDAHVLPEVSTHADKPTFKLESGEQVIREFSGFHWNNRVATHSSDKLDEGLFFYGQVLYRDELGIARRLGFKRKYDVNQHRFPASNGTQPHYEYAD